MAGPLPWREKIGDIRVHDYGCIRAASYARGRGWGSELL